VTWRDPGPLHRCELYGPDFPSLRVTVDYETNQRVHFKIVPDGVPRWEVPDALFPRPVAGTAAPLPDYAVSYTTSPFGLAVTRRATGEVLFNSTPSAADAALFKSLVYEDQYLEISTELPDNAAVYGLGERVRALRLAEGIPYTMWAADEATPQNQNVYGSHPYYVELRNGRAHGVVR
jgi:alpha-glucosidase (family GH31 glycosyl hydrolase)